MRSFPRARQTFKALGPSPSALKLLLLLAMSSRPRLGPFCEFMLRFFVRDGEIPIHYEVRGRNLEARIRRAFQAGDTRSLQEQVVEQAGMLDSTLPPELIVDGGGNIGLFTLNAAQLNPAARLVVCEPVPHNIAHIHRHLALNRMTAAVRPVCLGGSRRRITFYTRDADQGSFDPTQPYHGTLEVEVLTLDDILQGAKETRILIKLDIEGMELETLHSFVRPDPRQITVVGELHGHQAHHEELSGIFARAGWSCRYLNPDQPSSTFYAQSPACSS